MLAPTKKTSRAPSQTPQQVAEGMGTSALFSNNVCGWCGGALQASDHHYHSTRYPVRYICCKCAGHKKEKEAQ